MFLNKFGGQFSNSLWIQYTKFYLDSFQV